MFNFITLLNLLSHKNKQTNQLTLTQGKIKSHKNRI